MPKSIKPQQPQTIEEVYGLLPEVTCKGLCTNSCSLVPIYQGEAIAMKEAGITPPSYSPDLVCDKLKEGRCSIYEHRPFVCRVFGVSRRLVCPFGCKPSTVLTKTQEDSLDEAMRRLSAHAEVLPPVPSALYLGHDSELFNITRLLIEESNYRFQL